MRTACEVCQVTMIIPATDVPICERCLELVLEAAEARVWAAQSIAIGRDREGKP